MKIAHIITFLLLIIGGINWLLVGIAKWDIGNLFGGQDATISRVIYVLVGLSAVYAIATHKKECKACCGGKDECCGGKKDTQEQAKSAQPS